MPMRTVLGFVAYVADTGEGKPVILKGAQGQVYSVNDVGLTTPLACRDIATEEVIPNPTSNEDGFILPFKVSISDTASGILWVAGEYPIYQPFSNLVGADGAAATKEDVADALTQPGIVRDAADSRYAQPAQVADATARSYTVRTVPAGASPGYTLIRLKHGTTSGHVVKHTQGGDSNDPVVTRESADSYLARLEPSVMINAGGWWIDKDKRRMGLMIQNGLLIQDWEYAPEISLGVETGVFMRDGSFKVYDRSTPGAQIIEQGGYNASTFGKALYRDGVLTGIQDESRYRLVSARQMLGNTLDGDLIIVSFPGITNSDFGATAADVIATVDSWGIDNLVFLDGGGSLQTYVNGVPVVPSSDTAGRTVPDVYHFTAPANSPDDSAPFRFVKASTSTTVPHGTYTTIKTMVPGPGDRGKNRLPITGGVATIREAGIYRIEAQVFFPNDPTGVRFVAIRLNGSNRYRALQAAGQSSISVAIGLEVGLNAGDTIQLDAYQTSGGELTLPADSDGTRLSIRKLA